MRRHRPSVAFAALAFMAALATALAGCFGGSDGIENPKVELDLRGPDGGAAGSGTLRVYAGDYNPRLDSMPLLSKDFAGGAKVEVTAEEMDARLKAATGNVAAPADTQIRFNVVAVSGEREAFVAGFQYRRKAGTAAFALEARDGAADYENQVKARVELQDAVKGYEGAVGGAGVSYKIDYVYIPGSPYSATVGGDLVDGRKGGFKFARISQGTYSDLIGADGDSSHFYKSSDTLDTRDLEFTAGAWAPITIIDK